MRISALLFTSALAVAHGALFDLNVNVNVNADSDNNAKPHPNVVKTTTTKAPVKTTTTTSIADHTSNGAPSPTVNNPTPSDLVYGNDDDEDGRPIDAHGSNHGNGEPADFVVGPAPIPSPAPMLDDDWGVSDDNSANAVTTVALRRRTERVAVKTTTTTVEDNTSHGGIPSPSVNNPTPSDLLYGSNHRNGEAADFAVRPAPIPSPAPMLDDGWGDAVTTMALRRRTERAAVTGRGKFLKFCHCVLI